MTVLDLVPVTALSFDSTDLMRTDGLFLTIKRGLGEIPSVRGSDQVVPGRAGRIARARVADTLRIELEGIVGGIAAAAPFTEPVSYYALVLEMKALFDPTKAPAVLSCVLPDGSTATINVRTLPPLLWDEEIAGHFARLNVELESVDPGWVVSRLSEAMIATGGGIATAATKKQGRASVTATGGGVASYTATTNRAETSSATGGGVVSYTYSI